MRLSTGITLILCVLVVVTASTITALIFWRLDATLVQAKVDELQQETDIQSTHFTDRIEELTRDTRILAGTPPVQGIIRALDNDGTDPLDGSSLEVWQDRLAAIFREFLKNKPDYLQIRYIGLSNDGRELIRVDRNGPQRAIRRVPTTDLQPKASEPYFGATLQQPGTVYLSPINLNRERGIIQQPPVPVIRSALAIRDENEKLFGLIIINFDVRPVFARLARAVDPDHAYYLISPAGHYMHHAQDQYEFDFEYGPARSAFEDFPTLARQAESGESALSRSIPEDDLVVATRRMQYGPPETDHYMYVVATDSFADITETSARTLSGVGMALLLLVLAALAGGLWLARRLTWPMRVLTESVQRMDTRNATIDIPGPLPAEAGELARAFEQAIDTLHQRSEDLKASNRELQQFAYIASHDLQEPVRTVSSFTELLAHQYADRLDDRGQKYIRFILDSSKRMRELILGLLEYSRLGARSSPEITDIDLVLEDIIDDMGTTIEESGAAIKVDKLPKMLAYRLEVRLLFQNLIANAIKYRHPDRSPAVHIRTLAVEDGWRFEVQDNGLGIAPEHRDRVFLIFQRLHARHEYDGTGIGLAHCRKIVELHRGRIWIEGAADGGSVLKFELKEPEADEQTPARIAD